SWGLTDIASYQLTPEISLRNVFGFRSDKEQPSFDYDGSELPILDIANSRTWESNSLQVTEEFQVLGQNDDNSFNWILGFYHELDHPGGYSEVQRDTFGGAQPPVSPLSGFGTTEIDALDNGGTSTAIYGSATYNASSWINGLSFTAGGRYTWDHKIADSTTCYAGYPLFTGCPLPLPKSGLPSPPDTNYMNQRANFHAPTWTLAADYQVTDNSMVYATYRRGYKSGGFNSGAGSATDYAEFKPEYLTDVEVGTKNTWTIFGVPGRTNLDAYYGWYSDIQKNDEIGICTFDGTGCSSVEPAAITFNAARAKVKGIEFQSTIIPDENFQIDLFYSYTDAHYDQFVLPEEIVLISGLGEEAEGAINHAGNPFAYTPKNKFGITPRFHIPIDHAFGTPVLSASVYWQSSEWFTDLSDIETTCSEFVQPAALGEPYTCLAGAGQAPKQGAYTLVNLRFDWDNFMGSPFDLSLFATNVTNKTYKVADNSLLHLTGTSASIYGEPRMFGLEARIRFGDDAQR
ncbi:MAG TPA: TonB-dependent receptor, partial [Lacipirellulaceae bacterium]|nr:TonB-dependent receptor [Lacipirellulaceae bacterium]